MLKLRPPIESRERLVLALTGSHLVFLPWAWGTMHAWSQLTSCGLAAAAFLVAVWPGAAREGADVHPEATPTAWRRLVRFPLFWLGLAFVLLIVGQTLNISWNYERDARMWWMRRVDHISWLPTTIASPFGLYGAWRVLLFAVAAWLTVCTVWIGLNRRRSLKLLLLVVVGNAVVVAAVASVHRWSGESKLLWIRQFKDALGFGPFVYHNHGAAFLALAGVAALGLAAWYHFEALCRMARSSPALVWVLAWILIFGSVAVSGSRAGTGLLLVASLVAVLVFWLLRRALPTAAGASRALPVLVVALFLGWAAFFFAQADFGALERKIGDFRRHGLQDESYRDRLMARDLGYSMVQDRWMYGWGAGSFRFMFPLYAQRNPAVIANGNAHWEFLHNDWLQFVLEYGALGALLLAGALGWCGWRWVAWGGWRHPVAVMLLIACGQTLFHAWIDFPFQNPAILITWWVFMALGLRWLELEHTSRPV
jgi:O-antigen ligase